MIKPKLRRISLEPFIFETPAGKVIITEEMQALRLALQEKIDGTFATWQGPVVEPLPKITQKLHKVWKRVCWNKVVIS